MAIMTDSLNMPLTSQHYDTLIQAYAVSGDVNGAMSTFSYLQSMCPSGVSADMDMTVDLFSIRPTAQTMNVVLLACAKAGDFKNVCDAVC